MGVWLVQSLLFGRVDLSYGLVPVVLLDPPLQVDHVGHQLPIVHVAPQAGIYRGFAEDPSVSLKDLSKNDLLV